jgi:hypothetical protein
MPARINPIAKPRPSGREVPRRDQHAEQRGACPEGSGAEAIQQRASERWRQGQPHSVGESEEALVAPAQVRRRKLRDERRDDR